MKYITPMLETPRLILKRGTKEDYQKVYEYDFTKLRDIAGEFEYIKLSKEDLIGFDTYADDYDNVYDWIVYLKDKLIPVANITADREVEELKAIELAFNLHPKYWGSGIMKEAIISVIEYLFEQGYENILCGYSEGNIKSKKINEKIGFKLFYKIENSWYKNGIPITDYQTIISKKDFYSRNKTKIKLECKQK